jgi:streptogrisin C
VQTLEGSEWALQVIYQIGDVVVFEGHHYRALEAEQALENWTPPTQPALWQQID